MCSVRQALLGLAIIVAAHLSSAYGQAATCSQIDPSTESPSLGSRPLLPEDLVRLRDIGSDGQSSPNRRMFAVSPDKGKIAFQLRQADPESNSYCLAMFVIKVHAGAQPVIVDEGGELIRSTFDFRGKAAFPSGIPKTISPKWAPNGQWIAFLKRVGPATQIWRAYADGHGSSPLTNVNFDIDDFQITADGSTIIYSGQPKLREALANVEREALTGFHYDGRYAPSASDRPFPATPIPTEVYVQNLNTGAVRLALPAEARQLLLPPDAPDQALEFAKSASGRAAWLTKMPGNPIKPPISVVVANERGTPTRCTAPSCEGRISNLWWTSDGRKVRYFRLEGDSFARTAIYEWSPGKGLPRRVYSTEDVLNDCSPLRRLLICVQEGSITPRHISLLDPDAGTSKVLFNPNPQFSHLRLGRVTRFHWKNSFGIVTIGDLVLPVDYKPHTRYALVVVQYDTRGFLRGGTGDEFPIQAFANRGYAVLSFSRPLSIGYQSRVRNVDEFGKADLKDFADRRSVQSSLEIGIRALISEGIADPKRIGITGMSDGGSTAEFALLHSNLFAAAAMSSCCWDLTLPARVGPTAAKHFLAEGWPRLTDEGEMFWKEISLVPNARRVSIPILLQMADSEYASGLMAFTALREQNKPIDLFVFPNETHVKWQPAHRLAAFNRSIAWFDFWLKGKDQPMDANPTEVHHWQTLKKEGFSASASLHLPGKGQ